MYKILHKDVLHETVTRMVIQAPEAARHAKPGMFIILRIDERGERVPLTIADYDKEKGTITIIFQLVGATTIRLDTLNAGDSVLDLVGPLGNATEVEGFKKVAVIGGGLGVAIAFPQAKFLHKKNVEVTSIMGFRNTSFIILEDDMRQNCDDLRIVTDDGSNGHKGFVTTALKECLDEGKKFDAVIAIGPLPMMKAVCDMTKPLGIKTIVSMNSIMIDGTGMCGGCRVSVGGETKFACVDGPDFDGHLVDFDSAIARSKMYKSEEREDSCRMMQAAKKLEEKSK